MTTAMSGLAPSFAKPTSNSTEQHTSDAESLFLEGIDALLFMAGVKEERATLFESGDLHVDLQGRVRGGCGVFLWARWCSHALLSSKVLLASLPDMRYLHKDI